MPRKSARQESEEDRLRREAVERTDIIAKLRKDKQQARLRLEILQLQEQLHKHKQRAAQPEREKKSLEKVVDELRLEVSTQKSKQESKSRKPKAR